MQIEKRRIIVVGASRGLGRGVAVALAQAGARVLAIGRDLRALNELRESQRQIDILAGDATDSSFVGRVVSAEDPDAVFITLGATPVMRPIHQYRWESYCDVWNTDVKATFHWLQDLVNKPMRDGGRIVVFSSAAALRGSPLSGGYAPSKQAQRHLCDYTRDELASMRRALTLQCVLPQLNPNTDLGRSAVAAYAASLGESPEVFMKTRFGEQSLSPQIAGAEMVRLLEDDRLLAHPEFMLAGTGLEVLGS